MGSSGLSDCRIKVIHENRAFKYIRTYGLTYETFMTNCMWAILQCIHCHHTGQKDPTNKGLVVLLTSIGGWIIATTSTYIMVVPSHHHGVRIYIASKSRGKPTH